MNAIAVKENTAEGLRNRLFNALDGLIDGTLELKTVEGICYVSEQIIKTAQTEINLIHAEMERKKHDIQMRKEEALLAKEAITKLAEVIETIHEA